MRRLLVLAGLAAVVALGACSAKKTIAPNLAPQTTLFVQGTLDSVNHDVHLYWYGTDVDGYVVAYEFRFLNGANPADTQWVRTTAPDSLFSVYTPNGFTAPTFQVRAIDDHGLIDPSPAEANFAFTNQAPIVTIGNYPSARDTTYGSLTFSWTGVDPDGDANLLHYRVWVDNDAAAYDSTTRDTFTLAISKLMQSGSVVGGNHTINVQAVDGGGMAGPVASRQWYVRPTTPGGPAKLLIIDDMNRFDGNNFKSDTLFMNAVQRTLPPNSWSELRLEFTQPFRSVKDVEQTLLLYDAVLWYRGDRVTVNPNSGHLILPNYMSQWQDGIAKAIDGGARVLLEGLDLVDGRGAAGVLSSAFVSKYLDTDYMFKHYDSGDADSSVSWAATKGNVFNTGAGYPVPGNPQTLRMNFIIGGLRGFAVKDTNEVLLWARSGNLTQTMPNDLPIGLKVPYPASGGRTEIITVPVVLCTSLSLINPQPQIFLNNVILDLTAASSAARRLTLR